MPLAQTLGALIVSAATGLGAALLVPRAHAQTAGCEEDTLDRIKRTQAFNLGVRDATPPYGYKDASGKYVGFATELALAIYDAVNKELGGKIQLTETPVTGQTRVPLLLNGTIDMEAGASVITQARAKVVDFPEPHFLTATAVLVPADSPIKSLADLSGKRIGVPQGGLEDRCLSPDERKKGMAFRRFASSAFPTIPRASPLCRRAPSMATAPTSRSFMVSRPTAPSGASSRSTSTPSCRPSSSVRKARSFVPSPTSLWPRPSPAGNGRPSTTNISARAARRRCLCPTS